MPEPPDVDQVLVCWDCGTPIVRHADGAEKPCGHPGTVVVTRAEYERLRGSRTAEPPDFRSIARELARVLHHAEALDTWDLDEAVLLLTQVWNARGAADCAAVDDVAHTNQAAVAAAIRSVDR